PNPSGTSPDLHEASAQGSLRVFRGSIPMVRCPVRADHLTMNREQQPDEQPKEEPMENTTQGQPGPNPVWQQPHPGMRPPLARSRTDRKIAGVAGGLAAYLGIDPLWVRIGFVLISIPGGLGVLLYLLGWVLIPEEGEQVPIADGLLEHIRRAPTW